MIIAREITLEAMQRVSQGEWAPCPLLRGRGHAGADVHVVADRQGNDDQLSSERVARRREAVGASIPPLSSKMVRLTFLMSSAS